VQRLKNVLITGIAGEIGSSLATHLARLGGYSVTGFDVREPSDEVRALCSRVEVGDITNPQSVQAVGAREMFDTIFHLAGILSSGGERAPLKAHNVNVNGVINVLELARVQSELRQKSVTVVFTSTIAAYGIASLDEKRRVGTLKESDCLNPITMYGANKLYCESLGRYYSENYGMLEGKANRVLPNFRAVRFPGLLSAHTVPTGGTSDYAPEMVHAAAQGLPYSCFVRPDSRIPFMMMPDAVRALIMLSDADPAKLTQRVYNITSFAPTAQEIEELVRAYFPKITVSYNVHPLRQTIVDSWPENIDDSAARRDFGWVPMHTFEAGFAQYLIPNVSARYNQSMDASAVLRANAH
jgi:threonine 3-dehydrogenase